MRITRLLRTSLALLVALAAVLTVVAAGGAARAEQARRQLLYVNHAYGVLDRPTADAIEHSAYLRTFANFQVRSTTGSGGQTWTGRYLLGHVTYVELFGVGDVPDTDLGSTGMGVSVERAGELATVSRNLGDLGGTPVPFQQTRDFGDGVPVPWFDAVLTSSGPPEGFEAWGMEYRPEYFADPRSNTEPAAFPGDVGRERYLSDTYRDRLMRDVTGIHLAVPPNDLARTLPLLRAGGFAVRSTSDGAVAGGGGTTIRFTAVPRDQAGLRRLDFALNRPVARHVEHIGASALTVGPGKHAVWTFGS